MRRLLETVVCLAVALVVAGAWLAAPFAVVSGSMTPTLLGPHRDYVCAQCGKRNTFAVEQGTDCEHCSRCSQCEAAPPRIDRLPVTPGDRMLVDRSAYLWHLPRRWDVVALRLPREAGKIAVKRIVGLPNETVEVRDGELYVDGRLEPKPAVLHRVAYQRPADFYAPNQWKLGADEYFVLGDMPAVSDDSRSWTAGPGVATQLIIGKAFVVHFPYRTTYWYGRAVHVPDVSSIRYIR